MTVFILCCASSSATLRRVSKRKAESTHWTAVADAMLEDLEGQDKMTAEECTFFGNIIKQAKNMIGHQGTTAIKLAQGAYKEYKKSRGY